MAEWKKIIVSGSEAHLLNVTASNLTNDNLVVAGTGGKLESSGITWDGTSLAGITNITNSGGVGNSHITGSFTGSFIGDGSSLTGVSGEFPSTALNGTSLAATKFFVNDGDSKFVSGSQVGDYVYSGVSGDATIAAGGALTIASTAVETGMIANDAVTTAKIAHSLGTMGTHQFTGSFSGSFVGTTDLPDLTDGNGIADFTYDGSGTATVALDLDGSTLTVGSDGVKISDGGVGTTQIADSLGNMGENSFTGSFSGSFTGDGSALTNLNVDTTLEISGSSGGGSVALGSEVLTIAGTTNEITATAANQTITIGLPNDVTIAGNLNVLGTTTTINTANLLVEDRFALFNSGSASGDGGFIVQTESDFSGVALGYDDSEGRFGLQIGTKLAQNATEIAPDAYIASVVTSADANYQKNGNIRVESGDIYIYVE